MDNLKQIKQLATKQELMLLGIFCGIQLFQSALSYVAVPFQFEVPTFQCHSDASNSSFICTENQACSEYSNSYSILESMSSKSLTYEYGLYCTKRFDKALMQTLIIIGQGITCFFFSFFQIDGRFRKSFMFAAEISFLCLTIALFFTTRIQMISILLLFIQISYQTFYINVYTFVNENFNPEIKQVCTLIVSTAWGLSTFFYPIIYFIFQNWRTALLVYTIIPSIFLIGGLYYAFYYKRFKSNFFQSTDKLYSFKAIFQQKTVKSNFFFFTVIASIQYLCYTGANLSQDTIFGGLYFNMILFGFLEIFAGLVNIKIIHMFDQKNQIKYFCMFNAFNYLVFILQPSETKSSFLKTFFILCNLFGKIGFEMCWNVLLVYIQKLAPVYLHQVFFALMLSTVNLLNPVVPYYIETFKTIEISPLAGFGILYFVSIFLTKYLRELQQTNAEINVELKEIVLVDNEQKQNLFKKLILNKDQDIEMSSTNKNVKNFPKQQQIKLSRQNSDHEINHNQYSHN